MLPSKLAATWGVIPKGHNTGKWRLIIDLSAHKGRKVNDGIEPALCTLSYTTVYTVAEIIARMERGSLVAKIDT